jgi:hypothetical protein
MYRIPLALVFLLGLIALPACSGSEPCDSGDLECYCDQNPENCRDQPGLAPDATAEERR